jgi:amino acid adenylation domain-containing protein
MASDISLESVVAVCLDRSPQLIVSILASLKAGAAFLPLDPHLPQRRLSFMLEDSVAAAVLTHSSLARRIDFGPRPVFLLDSIEDELGGHSAADPLTAVGPDNLAYIIYTSGSTGEPKGVMIPHRGLTNLVSAQVKAFRIKPASRVLQFASISFDASVSEIFTALAAGATLVLADRERMMPGGELEKLLRQERISTVTLPPSALRVMSEQGLDELEVVVSAGERCTAEVVEKWGRGRKMINAYGPTEVTVCATMGECEAGEQEVTIGRAIRNADVYVLDRDLGLAPVGVKGEIYVGGAGVGRGYVGRADATAERYVPDPYGGEGGRRMYRTGDYGRYREGGRVEYIGRRDGQVKIRGYRIEVGEIEGVLRRDERVKEAAVEVREDEAGNKRLVAYVVGEAGSSAEEKEEWVSGIKRRIREEMPEYMRVWKVVRVEGMPRTVSGKIDRQGLRKLWEGACGEEKEERGVEGASNEVEEAMKRIWEEVLGVKGIGIHDNFFELGGHSLLGVQLIVRLRDDLGIENLNLNNLFDAPTVSDLLKSINQGTDNLPAILAPLQREGAKPPFFIIHGVGGDVSFFLEIMRHLGPDQPVYGIQGPELAKIGEIGDNYERIEDMAADYIKTIKIVQQEGPYFLGGMSYGGVVAFEMAQQLYKQKQEVALLALFDTVGPDTAYKLQLQDDVEIVLQHSKERARKFNKKLDISSDELEGLDSSQKLQITLEKLKASELLPHDFTLAWVQNFVNGFRSRIDIMKRYVPQTYPGRITFFRALMTDAGMRNTVSNFDDPTFGWSKFSTEPIDFYIIPGYHETMVQEPNATILAKHLKDCIDSYTGRDLSKSRSV